MEQEMITLPEYLSSRHSIIVVRRLFSVWCFIDHCLIIFLSSIVLSVLTDSVYPIGIFFYIDLC